MNTARLTAPPSSGAIADCVSNDASAGSGAGPRTHPASSMQASSRQRRGSDFTRAARAGIRLQSRPSIRSRRNRR